MYGPTDVHILRVFFFLIAAGWKNMEHGGEFGNTGAPGAIATGGSFNTIPPIRDKLS